MHRNVNDDFAARTAQNLPQPFIEIQFLRGQIKAGRLRLPGISFLLKIHYSS